MNGRGRMIILGLLAAAGVGSLALNELTVPKDGFAGAIGVAQRYQVTQITEKDVVLGHLEQVSQSNVSAGQRIAIPNLDPGRRNKITELDRHYTIIELGRRYLWNEPLEPIQ